MKKLILISILTILSLRTLAQEVNTDEYSDYKPCTECSTDKFKNSHSTGFSNGGSSHSSNKTGFFHEVALDIKSMSRGIVVGCVAVVTALTGVIIYTKLNNEISSIH